MNSLQSHAGAQRSRPGPQNASFAARRVHGFMRGEWSLQACYDFVWSLPRAEIRALLDDIQAEWRRPDLEGPDR